MFSTLGDIVSTPGGYRKYTGGLTIMSVGDIMRALRNVQYTGGIP